MHDDSTTFCMKAARQRRSHSFGRAGDENDPIVQTRRVHGFMFAQVTELGNPHLMKSGLAMRFHGQRA
jgi:hypothetical protein